MKRVIYLRLSLACMLLFCFFITHAQNTQAFKEVNGKIIDKDTKDELVFTDIVVDGTNISTVTNSDGEFLLKIPYKYLDAKLVITHLGYERKLINIVDLGDYEKIVLTPSVTKLNPVSLVASPRYDARTLVEKTLANKSTAYNDKNALMTAFYRETIKKRRKNASLSEAVVKIHKQPYSSLRNDHIELIKSRKNIDYSRLDTLALKLQGGPFSNLYTDLVKYPEYIFNKDDIDFYDFNYENSTNINKNLVYVVNFKQKPHVKSPLYYGRLYIDANTLALTNAEYNLNVKNKELSSSIFVRKKPRKVDVYPTEASYKVKYRTQNGRWHYAYSNIGLTFKVNWEGKLFNSIYTLNSEMAITDWEIPNTKITKTKDRMLRPTTILTEQTSGFSDPEFWGTYNIIEPEKSIENAIRKIKKQLDKKEERKES
ncbi:carboxypeptidase-like regulatory domain-containing protein [Hyunsoonleella pacifica]|uniref:Carboxypeptidase-like regulatory domain-containing protein n=1 Tax=Hyunsoonleella pacifica TaxID=1080224 RepID=A0A4Q9FND5_9FLAO|nr:carboxypeptidase-like regulatory domain-containing protein [Hyunsoonleella pacifica]TBN13831.1 carboxypeptidase-like regulatory domain-containing protein [Hyunsoonleella pacifica]